jgi:hypothetical protein
VSSTQDSPPYGQYTPPPMPEQPRKRHRFRNFVVIPLTSLIGLIVIFGIIGAIAGGGAPKTIKAPAVAPSSAPASSQPQMFTDPAGGSCPAAQENSDGYCPGDEPAATPSSQNLTGPLGTTFTTTETDSSTGAQNSYDVTAVTILDPARGSDEFNTADAGKRLVGVEFKVTGTQGYSNDDANNDASIQGSDGQVYQPDFTSLAAGTNFNSGDFSVSSGQTQTGWITFQLPLGVKIDSIQWQADVFGNNPPAIWQL